MRWILILFSLFYSSANLFAKAPNQEKLFLITGCARSGTSYIANFLRRSGISVGLEVPSGRQGCVSWSMLFNEYSLWGPINTNVTFKHIFHQVRNPLNVITSWYVNFWPDHFAWDCICRHVPEIRRQDPFFVRCAAYWYYWNLKAEEVAEWTYCIENLPTVLHEFERRLGLKLDATVLQRLPTNFNHWKPTKNKVTWKYLKENLPADLFHNIQEMAERYGYPTTDLNKWIY